MTTGSILLGVALLVAVGLFVARPFLRPATIRRTDFSSRQALEAQKEATLAQIRELDFDHETGKVPEEEYQTLRQKLLAEAASIFKELDALQPAVRRSEAADDMEAAIARLRKKAGTATTETAALEPATAEEDIEAAVARLRRQPVASAMGNGQKASTRGGATTATGPSTKRAGFCPQCGEARDSDDRFCAFCGHAFA